MKLTRNDLALRVTLLYILFASLWILVSDQVLLLWVTDPVQLATLETGKGWLFVIATAGLLFFVLQGNVASRQRAEAALRASEERYRDLYDNAPIACFSVGPDGVIRHCNPLAGDLLGYSIQELTGLPVVNLYADTPGGNEIAGAVFQRLQASEIVRTEQIQVRKADGRSIWIGLSVKAIKDEQGQVVEFRASAVDITEQLHNQSELRNLSKAVQQSPVSVVITDLSGNIEYINPKFTQVSGYTLEEVLGRNPRILRSGHTSGAEYRRLWETITSGGEWTGEFHNRRKNGELYWESASISPITDDRGAIRHFIAIKEDITARKQAEWQIKRQLKHLNALRTIDIAITSSFDMRFTLDVLLTQVIEQLDVDTAAILLLHPHTQMLNYAASHGFHSRALQHSHLKLGQGYAGRVALERRIVHVPDIVAAGGDLARALSLANENFVAYFGIPLIAKGQVKGVLEIFHRAPLDAEAEWLDFLEALEGQAAIAIDNAQLFDGLQRSNAELGLAYDATIEGWSRALDLRDKETEGHTLRVTDMTLRLARTLSLSDPELIHIRRGALLHDIGKMGVPDSILLKADNLTEAETEIMRRHPTYAYEMLAPIIYLKPALDIPYCHHEKWDGTGYPRGLKGEQIPLAARMFAIVDVWDALRSDRPYRAGWLEGKVREYIQAQAGYHFDPRLVNVFFKLDHRRLAKMWLQERWAIQVWLE